MKKFAFAAYVVVLFALFCVCDIMPEVLWAIMMCCYIGAGVCLGCALDDK